MVTVEDFRQSVVEFIETAVADGVACPSFGAIMPPALFERARTWQQHCFANGFAGVDWPTEYGGQGLSFDHAQAWNDECARHGVAAYMNFQGFVLAGGAILKFGTEEQKQRYLRATLAAEILWCQLFSEPDAGSDLVSLGTRAEPTGDGWLVNGQKVWSSTAQLAQHAILLARTNPDEAGHRGISFFLFDMNSPGVEVRPITQMTGDQEFCEVFLVDAPLAEQDLLGPLHGGWTVATSVLADERASVGAAGIALRRSLGNLATDATSSRPVSRQNLMELTATGESLLQLFSRSAGDPMLGPLTKLANTEISSAMTRFAIDSQGPAGMIDNDSTEPFLYAPGMRVAGGTSEIQRNLIGERLLGLPREPRS